jgi:general secretion pathway protein E
MGVGAILVERGVITRDQLDAAVREQQTTGERIDRVLTRQGVVSSRQVLEAVADQLHLPVVDLSALRVEPETLAALPAKLVFKQRCVPILKENGTLTVATSDPLELTSLDELRLITNASIELVLADEDELNRFIRTHFGVGGDTLDEMSAGMADTQTALTGDEVEQAQEASVIKLVNDLLAEAISERATDVHIEPYERELAVRYRIDGVLQRANVPATISRFGAAIVSRLKIMASLNIAEKRKPQDGRITFRSRGPGNAGPLEEFDLRLSIIPMIQGEGVVLRVLNKSAALMPLDGLGMPEDVLTRWDGLINRAHGIALVTGPTGSGKSTTLYASLNRIVSDEVKCITVEDPVEYHVAGVNQIQVNGRVGLDFAAGLRAILRHDPDVIMIGEIRDKETAETAIQASLTGHLVFSTLHTNDAPGAVTRLLDMGVEPFLISSTVEGVLAQRLVRRICAECASLTEPDPALVPASFGLRAGEKLMQGAGCRACRNTGYRGRVGMYELLTMSEHAREQVMKRVNAPTIASDALRDGSLLQLRDDGFRKVRQGLTTIAEVLRAVTA